MSSGCLQTRTVRGDHLHSKIYRDAHNILVLAVHILLFSFFVVVFFAFLFSFYHTDKFGKVQVLFVCF